MFSQQQLGPQDTKNTCPKVQDHNRLASYSSQGNQTPRPCLAPLIQFIRSTKNHRARMQRWECSQHLPPCPQSSLKELVQGQPSRPQGSASLGSSLRLPYGWLFGHMGDTGMNETVSLTTEACLAASGRPGRKEETASPHGEGCGRPVAVRMGPYY